MIAALLTRMSIPPNASTAASAMALVDSADRTSTPTPTTGWPFALNVLGRRVGGVGVEVGEHDRGASVGERLGVHDPDASRTTGDDGDLAGQIEELGSTHGVDRTTMLWRSQVS